jgi:hypothetical protein
MPVTFPPGRVRLSANPVATMSPQVAQTIEVSRVACLAATAVDVNQGTITSTLSSLVPLLIREDGSSVLGPIGTQAVYFAPQCNRPRAVLPETTARIAANRGADEAQARESTLGDVLGHVGLRWMSRHSRTDVTARGQQMRSSGGLTLYPRSSLDVIAIGASPKQG